MLTTNSPPTSQHYLMTMACIDLTMKESNIPVHLDVEEDIKKKKDGLITFTLRINNGNVVDYNKTEYVDAKTKYFGNGRVAEFRLSVKRATKEQPAVPLYNGKGDTGDSLRNDYF